MPIEDLYLAYRKTAMHPDEVLGWIKVPKPMPAPRSKGPRKIQGASGELCRVYKISKRFEDDISAVCLALNIRLKDGTVVSASIGAGGVAATPMRARATQAALLGQPWNAATIHLAMTALRAEFSPISDMRATGAYRSQVLGNLLWRFWLESQGSTATDLQTLTPMGLETAQP
jgi:xanthine dehydrogenase small subunit